MTYTVKNGHLVLTAESPVDKLKLGELTKDLDKVKSMRVAHEAGGKVVAVFVPLTSEKPAAAMRPDFSQK